jgi:hypothetical protein
MRDSINYNLKYFIVRTSGTKPMKNTMRKQSPLKFGSVITASLATKEGKASYEASRPKSKPSSKPAAPRGPLARAKALAEDKANRAKAATIKKPSDGNSTANPSSSADVKKKVELSRTRLGELKAAKEKKEPTKAKATVSNQGVKNLRASIKAKAAAKAAGKTETSVKEVAPKSNPAGKPSAKPTATETSVKSTTKSPTSVKSSTETSAKAPTMQMKKSGMGKKC